MHSNHALPVVDNRLAQTFAAMRPNETWVTDITSVPTAERWLYVAGLKDLYRCEVVGHAMGGRMTTDLVSQALVMAVGAKRPRPGLIHHSDRGSQYCAQAYQDRIRQFGMTASMSRRGNCYDNAPNPPRCVLRTDGSESQEPVFEDVVRHTTGVPVHDMVLSFEGLDELFVENFKVDRHHKAEGHRMMAEHMANDIGHGLTHNNAVESQVEGNMA